MTKRAIVTGNSGRITHHYREGTEVYARKVSAGFNSHYECRQVGGMRLSQAVSREDLHFIDDRIRGELPKAPEPIPSAGTITFWVVITAFTMLVIGIAIGYIIGGG